MKNIYLILIALFINYNSFSQDDLTGTWYLHYLIIDNIQVELPNNQPPYYDDYNFLKLVFFDTDNDGSSINDFHAYGPCDSVFGDYIVTNSYISLFNVYQTLGGCGGAGGTVPLFENKFGSIWQGDIVDYSSFGENNETLVITDSLGNQAVYGRNTVLQTQLLGEWFLYTVTVDDETQSYVDINYFSNIVFVQNEFYGNVCNGFYSEYFIDSDNKINVTYFVQTLACLVPPPPAGYEHNLFYEVLTNFDTPLPNILDYTITGTGNDATLVLTDFEGDTAVYGRLTLSNNEFEELNKVKIYPNPVKNVLNVDLVNYSKEVTLTIYSSSGKIILDNLDLKDNNINVDFLESGLYFLKIESENQSKHLKFIKQ